MKKESKKGVRKRGAVRRGSMTVEAACLMSLVLFVIMGSLYLFFFVHNRAWLTAAAYEAAVSGCLEYPAEEERASEAAEQKGTELGNTGFFGGEDLTLRVSAGDKVQVSYEMEIAGTPWGFDWQLQAAGEASLIRPVSWIRKTKAAAELLKEAAGE